MNPKTKMAMNFEQKLTIIIYYDTSYCFVFSTPCNLEGLINITYENTLTTCQYNLLSYENYMKTL